MKYADSSGLIIGNIGVADVNATKQVRDVTAGCYEIYPDNESAPILAVLSRIKHGRKAWNVKHEWHDRDYFPRWDTVASVDANNGTTAVTITPNNPTFFVKFDTIELFGGAYNHGFVSTKSGSQIIITSVDGSSTLNITAGDPIHIYSRAMEELSTMPTAKNTKVNNRYNFQQFMRYPTTIGIFEDGTRQYTGKEWTKREKEQMLEIKMSAERMIHFGDRGSQTGPDGEQIYFCRGVKRWTETGAGENILNWSGGSLSEQTFRDWLMEGPCKYGSKRKFFPMSTELWMQIDNWAGTKQYIQAAGGHIDILGMTFTRYMAPNGRILHMHHHHMYEQQYEGAGQIMDLASIRLLPFGENGILGLHKNMEANDLAGRALDWWFLATVEVERAEFNGYIHRN